MISKQMSHSRPCDLDDSKGHFNKPKPQNQHFLPTHCSFFSYSHSLNDHLSSWRNKMLFTCNFCACSMHHSLFPHKYKNQKSVSQSVLPIFACLRLHCSSQRILISREFPFTQAAHWNCFIPSPQMYAHP